MLLYYITDRSQFPGDEDRRRALLLERIAQAAAAGVDFIQLREKDLPARALAQLAESALKSIETQGGSTKLLINSRLDVALATGAHGVHLTSADQTAEEVRVTASRAATGERNLLVAVSCHSPGEVRLAARQGADFAVLAPIFEKVLRPSSSGAAAKQTGIGCDALRQATEPAAGEQRIPVLALGGVNLSNAIACMKAGAAGIAGIRLFQEGNIEETVRRLRAIS